MLVMEPDCERTLRLPTVAGTYTGLAVETPSQTAETASPKVDPAEGPAWPPSGGVPPGRAKGCKVIEFAVTAADL